MCSSSKEGICFPSPKKRYSAPLFDWTWIQALEDRKMKIEPCDFLFSRFLAQCGLYQSAYLLAMAFPYVFSLFMSSSISTNMFFGYVVKIIVLIESTVVQCLSLDPAFGQIQEAMLSRGQAADGFTENARRSASCRRTCDSSPAFLVSRFCDS